MRVKAVQWRGCVAALGLAAISLTGGCGKEGAPPAGPTAEAPAGEQAKPEGKTLANLQAAYNGESNAHAKYVEYAKKADAEGYRKVAVLFRAAAEAEKIHADNHAVVIKEMGATPEKTIKLPEIKTTKENLADAIKGESYERDTMYPEFLAQARKEGKKAAIRTFNFAKSAEAQHAKYYTQALKDLDAWKAAGQAFFVCPVCGETVDEPTYKTYKKCPVCFTPGEQFKKIT